MCKRKVIFVKVVNFDHREKKQSFPFFRYNHLFENMNWFSIPNFRIKVVLWIYAIGKKGLLKNFVGSSRIQQNAISCYREKKTCDAFQKCWNNCRFCARKPEKGEEWKQKHLHEKVLQDDHHGFLNDAHVALTDKTQASDPTKK